MEEILRAKKDMIEVGRELYNKGMIVGTDGNLSVRVADDKIIITASGVCKGKMELEDLSIIDMKGNLLEGKKPARDMRMHLAVYEQRADAVAVVHAHPITATGISMCDINLDKVALPEVLFNLNGVAFTDYCTPITIEVPREVGRVLRENVKTQAIILANHGALCFGKDVWDAFYKLETLEMFCKTTLVARQFGNIRYLNDEQLKNVYRLVDGEHPDDVIKP